MIGECGLMVPGGIGFGGLFDGQGHVISNLKINRTDAGKLGCSAGLLLHRIMQ